METPTFNLILESSVDRFDDGGELSFDKVILPNFFEFILEGLAKLYKFRKKEDKLLMYFSFTWGDVRIENLLPNFKNNGYKEVEGLTSELLFPEEMDMDKVLRRIEPECGVTIIPYKTEDEIDELALVIHMGNQGYEIQCLQGREPDQPDKRHFMGRDVLVIPLWQLNTVGVYTN